MQRLESVWLTAVVAPEGEDAGAGLPQDAAELGDDLVRGADEDEAAEAGLGEGGHFGRDPAGDADVVGEEERGWSFAAASEGDRQADEVGLLFDVGPGEGRGAVIQFSCGGGQSRAESRVTAMTCPAVTRWRSAGVRRKTARGVPAAAQISSKARRS